MDNKLGSMVLVGVIAVVLGVIGIQIVGGIVANDIADRTTGRAYWFVGS